MHYTSITYPDSSADTATFSYSTGSSLPWTITETKAESSSANFSTEKILDGLGRTVTSEVIGDPGGTDYVVTTYNNLGQVTSVSQPYRSGGTVYNTSYNYDALSRVTYIQTPNALNKYISYSGRATDVQLYPYWDDKQTISQVDGMGRVTNVCEVTSTVQQGNYGTPSSCGLDIAGTGFLTQYTYDASGNLISMGQEMNVTPLGARNFTYDGLSRLTSEATPEQSLGTTYTYDTLQAGDLYQRIAPLENSYSGYVTTTYSFDAMHRIKNVQYNDNLTSGLWFYYDSAGPLWQGGPTVTNPKGRMVEAGATTPTSQTAFHAFGYDPMGRTSYHFYQPPSLYETANSYTAGYSYDFLGNPMGGTNFVASWNNYYNALGQLQTIWSTWLSPTQNGDLMWNRLYNAASQPVSDSLANTINETWAYDGANNPVNYGTGGVSYTYSVGQWLGNDFVVSAYDNIIGQWTYTYDNIGRLATATCSSGNCPLGSTNTPAFSYQYDPVGNRWKQNVTAGTGPSVQVSFSYQHNWLVGNSYDVAGNVTNDGNHSYTYDAEGRILQVSGGGVTESNIYDAFGRISSQTTGSGATEWVYDLSGHVIAQSPAGSTTPSRADFWEGGRHWAYSPDMTNLYYIHSDWLGTERATSNLSLTQGGGVFSLPFGDGVSFSGNGPAEQRFTDQSHDINNNLERFPARSYSSQFGIWMRPDPAGLAAVDITNPQSWNRYAYVTNNPLSFVDPLGLDEESWSQSPSGAIMDSTLVDVTATYLPESFVPLVYSPTANSIGNFQIPGETVNVTATPLGQPQTVTPNNGEPPSDCELANIAAVNSVSNLKVSASNVVGEPFVFNGGLNVNFSVPGASPSSLPPGRYPSSLLDTIFGIGSSLHVTGPGGADPSTYGIDPSTGNFTFTTHIDTAYATWHTPIGALIHYFVDVRDKGAHRTQCGGAT